MATDTIDPIKLDMNNLDKSDWKTYRFDEIAQNISERVDPNDTDLEVYVGLEHLDSESLHITRHGSPDDVNGTKLRFYKGDIIFGRRRAYQRKAGIATWDGFCSAHALVLRANPDVIHPDLFPFFIHSDLFMNRAVDISVGSLSPTINWGTLKHQEFLIPPEKIQVELIKVFNSIQNNLNKNHKLEVAMKQYFHSVSFYEFKYVLSNSNSILLEKLLASPISNGVFKTKDDFGNGTLLINVTDIYESFVINPEKLDRVNVNNKEKISFSAECGDIIFNRSSLVADGIGHTCLVPDFDEDMVFECHLMRVRPNQNKIDSRYLCRYCLSPFGRKYLISRSQTTTMTTINQGALNKMPIPLPELSKQKEIADLLDQVETIIKYIQTKIIHFKELQQKFINKAF